MKKTFIIGLALLFQYQLSCAQKDSLKYGLKGKIIRALEKTTTSSFYAGLKGNSLGTALIYKSEDSGVTWLPLNNGEPISPYASDIQTISVANDPLKTIYAGTWKDGLFKSVNDGKTWEKDLKFPSSDIRSIKTGIQSPRLVYAATSSFGVVKSTDGGKTWKRNNPKIIDSTFQFAWSIELDKNDDNIIFAQTFNKGVWKSTNQGETWKQILNTAGKVCWDMKISKDSKEIWVASSKSGDSLSSVYYSNNRGNTWEEIQNVPQVGVNQINVIEQDNKKTLIVGSWQQGIFIYKDQKWIKNDFVDFNTISEILINDTDILIGSWGNGIYNITL